MDTNLVQPLTGSSIDRCRVVFDYWLDADALRQAAAGSVSNETGTSSSTSSQPVGLQAAAAVKAAALESQFVQDSLASSHQVQV